MAAFSALSVVFAHLETKLIDNKVPNHVLTDKDVKGLINVVHVYKGELAQHFNICMDKLSSYEGNWDGMMDLLSHRKDFGHHEQVIIFDDLHVCRLAEVLGVSSQGYRRTILDRRLALVLARASSMHLTIFLAITEQIETNHHKRNTDEEFRNAQDTFYTVGVEVNDTFPARFNPENKPFTPEEFDLAKELFKCRGYEIIEDNAENFTPPGYNWELIVEDIREANEYEYHLTRDLREEPMGSFFYVVKPEYHPTWKQDQAFREARRTLIGQQSILREQRLTRIHDRCELSRKTSLRF